MWKLNALFNSQFIEEVTREIDKHLKPNENENTTPNLWDAEQQG